MDERGTWEGPAHPDFQLIGDGELPEGGDGDDGNSEKGFGWMGKMNGWDSKGKGKFIQ